MSNEESQCKRRNVLKINVLKMRDKAALQMTACAKGAVINRRCINLCADRYTPFRQAAYNGLSLFLPTLN